MKPFNLLRACFWLLAIMIVLELLASIAAGVLCWWINFIGPKTPNACGDVGTVIRDVWSELLTAVLALLLAARPPPSGKD